MRKLVLLFIVFISVFNNSFGQWTEFENYKESMVNVRKSQFLREKNDSTISFGENLANSFNIYDFNLKTGTKILVKTIDNKANYNFLNYYFNDDILVFLERATNKVKLRLIIYDLKQNFFIDSLELFEISLGSYAPWERAYKGSIYYDESNKVLYFAACNYVQTIGKVNIPYKIGGWGFSQLENNKIKNFTTIENPYTDMIVKEDFVYLHNDLSGRVSKYDKLNNKMIHLLPEERKPLYSTDFLFDQRMILKDEKLIFAISNQMYEYNLTTSKLDSVTNFYDYFHNLSNSFNKKVGIYSDTKNKTYFLNLDSYSVYDSIEYQNNFKVNSFVYLNQGNQLLYHCTDSTLRLIDLTKFYKLDADFTASDTMIYKNQKIKFYKKIPDDDCEYLWTFGGSNLSSSQEIPVVSFDKTGRYDISLTITKNGVSKTTVKSKLINVKEMLKSDFTSDITKGRIPLKVKFKNLSSGEDLKFHWSFGDGTYSTEKEPEHTYSKVGAFNVKLITIDSIGKDTIVKYQYINTDSTDIEIVQPKSIIKLLNNCNYEENYTLPIRAYELTPGTIYAIEYNKCGSYNMQTFVGQLRFKINKINDDKIFSIYDLNDFNLEDIVQSTYGFYPFSFNFYPDSCLNGKGVFNQSLLNMSTNESAILYQLKGGGKSYPIQNGSNFEIYKYYNYVGNTFYTNEILIHNNNLYPIGNNKSYVEFFSRKDTVFTYKGNEYKDKIFNSIRNYSLTGNVSVFQGGHPNEYMAPRTFVGDNKNDIDILVYDNLGSLIRTVNNKSSFSSLIIHDFRKLNDNEYIAVGLSGSKPDSGLSYIAKFDINGKLLAERAVTGDLLYLYRIIKASNTEFFVMYETKSKNKGFFLFDNNLNRIKDYKIADTTFYLADIFMTSDKRLKILGRTKLASNLWINTSYDILAENKNEISILFEIENDLPVSVEENIKIEDVSKNTFIFPNPATDYITINLGSIGACSNENNIWASPNASVEIYDVMGVLIQTTPVETKNFSSLQQRLDISNLSPGVYFVKIKGSNGDSSIVEKFVKIN